MARHAVVLAASALFAASCGTATSAPERATVAFVMIGSADDLGYNQAVDDGALELARRFPDLEILRIEDVPETQEAERVIRELVEVQGADIVFATSFGHLPHAYVVAKDHPAVTFLHQGGVEPSPGLHNFGTFFGSHWEAMYEAGIAAGHATESGLLGFVAAFPIPATLANVNAFTLGAQQVRPDTRTLVTFTEDWCDPELQRQVVGDLAAAGADVLGLHQDCTTAILQEAESLPLNGVVGYHADGSEVAPNRWLAGAVWTWGDLYIDIVESILDGRFDEGPYARDFRGSIADGNNPFTLTEPGPAVAAATAIEMLGARNELAGCWTPFTGPLVDNQGTLRVPEGVALTVLETDAIDWFVAGVEVR